MNVYDESLKLHEEKKGKLAVASKVPVNSKEDLSLAYTPGVAEPCRKIAENKENAYKYTFKGNTVAVVSDGSAVLGLGNIGPEAALPVMEGKAVLFKGYADIDAFPICLDTQDVDKIVETVKLIAPVFGGVNLEDIKAPQCFEVEKQLQDLGIPVMHDDQHGTAIVCLAATINALKVVGKEIGSIKVAMSGAGSAAIAIAKLLNRYGAQHIVMCDSKGIVSPERDDLNPYKQEIAQISKPGIGSLADAMNGADLFIGVSKKDVVSQDMVKSMNEGAIVIAMANPDPEILPDDAKAAGAAVVATGRSDFANQVNNVLAFPGIFRGALDIRATRITEEMKLAAAVALAAIVEEPTAELIIPHATNKEVVPMVAQAVKDAWTKSQ